jgi:hypothetical protein
MTPDIFLVHHENYHTVREAVGKAVLASNIDDLNVVIQVSYFCRLDSSLPHV